MARSLLLSTLIGLAALETGRLDAAVLYSQPYNGIGAIPSQNDWAVDAVFTRAYDNFTLDRSATVTALDFTGRLQQRGDRVIRAFQVELYSGNASEPTAFVGSQYFAGNGSQRCAGITCSYRLPVRFDLDGGTTYWLSIVPELLLASEWGWGTSADGDGRSLQRISDVFEGYSSTFSNPTDLAFTLSGSADAAVPEPSAWAMMAAGLLLIGSVMRRGRAIKAALPR